MKCPFCGKNVRVVVPKDGDGSADVFVRHMDTIGKKCMGSRRLVELEDPRKGR